MTDAIIIGAGHNGLVCAARLAQAGREVTVLEANDRVGGAAVTREFAPGFRVSSAAHLLYALDPGIVAELELERHGLRYAAEDLYTIALDPSGQWISIADGALGGPGALDEDRVAMAAYHRQMNRFAGILHGLKDRIPPRMGTRDRGDLLALGRLLLSIRRLGREDMREFLRIAGINVHDVLEERFRSDLLKGALGLDGTLGTMLGPRSNNSVFCALHRCNDGRDYALPAGGMGALSEAIAAAARAAGAEIHCNQRVRRIVMDGGRATGVELENGERLHADTVISNADPRTTFNTLLGARHLEAGFAHRVRNIRSRGCVAKLHLALRDLPAFTGLDAAQAGQRLVAAPSLDYVEQAFNHAKYRRCSEDPVLELSIPTLHDPELAPDGRHVLSASVQWAPVDLAGGWTDEARAAFADRAVTVLERYAPGLRGLIEHRELLAPPDLEAAFGMSGGHWHHAELALDQFLMMRPVPGAAQYATPVDGLYLCGAGCHPGGGVMGCAGRNAARVVLAGTGQERSARA